MEQTLFDLFKVEILRNEGESIPYYIALINPKGKIALELKDREAVYQAARQGTVHLISDHSIKSSLYSSFAASGYLPHLYYEERPAA